MKLLVTTPMRTNNQRILRLFKGNVVTPRPSAYQGRGFSASRWQQKVTSGGNSVRPRLESSSGESETLEDSDDEESERSELDDMEPNQTLSESSEKVEFHCSMSESSDTD